MAGLKLEYSLLESALSERDGAIAGLRSQLRRTAAAAKAAASSHAAEARELRHQLQQVLLPSDVVPPYLTGDLVVCSRVVCSYMGA